MTSGYHTGLQEKLRIFLITEGWRFRAHGGDVFFYDAGCWRRAERLPPASNASVNQFLVALEGLMITLGAAGPAWNWPEVRSEISATLQNTTIRNLQNVAKKSLDHNKLETRNKPWSAAWGSKLADKVQKIKEWFDSQQKFSSRRENELFAAFVTACATPLPQTKGVVFADGVYLSEEWEEMPPRPSNDCYTAVKYDYFSRSDSASLSKFARKHRVGQNWTVEQHEAMLDRYIRSFYYNNRGLFIIKMSFLNLAFSRTRTSKQLWLVGRGGDGKQLDGLLDRNVVGEANFANLDGNALADWDRFRKVGHKIWGRAVVRISEMPGVGKFGGAIIQSDIWKKLISGDGICCLPNYGQPEDKTFGDGMIVQECNEQNVPVIERNPDSPDVPCEAVFRRVLCGRLSKMVLVTDESRVSEESGVFLSVDTQQMVDYVTDPFTATLYLHRYLLPFFRSEIGSKAASVRNIDRAAGRLAEEPPAWEMATGRTFDEATGSTFRADTLWLAKKLCGVVTYDDEHIAADSVFLRDTLIEAQMTQFGVAEITRRRGLVYKALKCTASEKLATFERMLQATDAFREINRGQSQAKRLFQVALPLVGQSAAIVGRGNLSYEEIISIPNLTAYLQTGVDRRQECAEALLAKAKDRGIRDIDGGTAVEQLYAYKEFGDGYRGGRRYALNAGTALQGVTRECRQAAAEQHLMDICT